MTRLAMGVRSPGCPLPVLNVPRTCLLRMYANACGLSPVSCVCMRMHVVCHFPASPTRTSALVQLHASENASWNGHGNRYHDGKGLPAMAT